MNSEAKAFIKGNLQVQLERDPHITVRDMEKWLLSDQQKNMEEQGEGQGTQEQGAFEEHHQ